jgi:hypothetical protein
MIPKSKGSGSKILSRPDNAAATNFSDWARRWYKPRRTQLCDIRLTGDAYRLRFFQLELRPLESLNHDYRPGSAYSPALVLVKLRAARAGTEILVTVSATFRSPASWNATSPFILVSRTY